MAELKFTIPDARMSELIDAWGMGYRDEIPDPGNPGEVIPNPQTKPQFAKENIRRMIVERVKTHQGQQLPELPVT